MTEVALTRPSGDSTELPYPDLAPAVLGWFKQTTRPRNWCLKVACSPWLDQVSILVILVNCAIQGLNQPGRKWSYNLEIVDIFVTAFFMVEMLIKMLAKGGFGYEGSYLSSHWNKLDLFINLAELSFCFLESLGLNVKVFRVLGPMRLFSRVKSMRDALTLLLDRSWPASASELFLLCIFTVMRIQGVSWVFCLALAVVSLMAIINSMN